ncbi:MAG TPA: hypothetical protein VMT43_11835 [Acidimicrobiales bacterium]|nr:hypothetical protein [Acidimicrobiales bacterium]
MAGDGRDLDAELDGLGRWAAEQRVAEAVGERRRTAWLGRQPDRAPQLADLLVTVAERGRPVLVELSDGRRHRGLPSVVGRDVVELRTASRTVLVALHAVRSIRVTGDPGDAATSGPRTDLAGELGRWAEDRPTVQLVTVGTGEPMRGTLLAAGPHLVTLRLTGGDLVYVPLAALAEVSLPESG